MRAVFGVTGLASLVAGFGPSTLNSHQRCAPAGVASCAPLSAVHLRRAMGQPRMMGLMEKLKGEKAAPNDSTFFSEADNEKLVAAYMERVERINALEDDIEELDDAALAAKTVEFKNKLAAGASEDDILEEAFAVVREAAWRALELRHYDVQLVGAIALHEGKLAQMGTGEGKTLVATCAVYLNALRGEGALLVTVNDYLARRDSETMGQVYRFLGLEVGLVQAGMEAPQRRAAYAADITYVTNSELGFDYLRDNLAMTPAEIVLRSELNYCVVDEGDSVLVDEARVPLIISGKIDAPVSKYSAGAKLANALEVGTHYEVFEKEKTISLTERGQSDCERTLAVDDLFDPKNPWASYVVNAIKAKELFLRDKDYIIRDGEVQIVDEFSGRVMDGRRWGDGLHQAVEAKEGLTVGSETETVASITYQSLFRRFKKLSSMSGTALTEAEEFATIYNLKVVDVPPVLPKARVDIPPSVYKTTRGKSQAALEELLKFHRQGRPVLVGTTSVESSQAFSAKLTEIGLKHEVLNAAPDVAQREAEIVAQAGRPGAITISTNMAGRGTDILLGGNPSFMARLYLREKLGAATNVDVPAVREGFYPATLNDETAELVDAAVTKHVADSGAKLAKGAPPLSVVDLDEILAIAASAAPVDEDSVYDYVRDAYEAVKEAFDEVLGPEKAQVIEAGGLHVLGTNLAESRRVDDQLRGRAGRQGDPGSSHFFLSLEDRVFRLFGGDKITGLLDFLRISEETALESDQVIKAIGSTQDKVERYYYELRKGLFDYDEVIAAQRQATYADRGLLVRSDEDAMHARMSEMVSGVVRDIVGANAKGAALDDATAEVVHGKLLQFFPNMQLPSSALSKPTAEAEAAARSAALEALKAKEAELDATKPGLSFESQRFLALVQVDTLWKAHVKAMNYVKDFAGLKVYANQDPLDVYREEGLELYEQMKVGLRQNTVYSFFMYQPREA